MVRNTKGEQWTAKPQARRKQNIRALYLEPQYRKEIDPSVARIRMEVMINP